MQHLAASRLVEECLWKTSAVVMEIVCQEDVDSDYRCGDGLQRRTYGSRASVGVPANFVSKRGPAGVVISRHTRFTLATGPYYAGRFRTTRCEGGIAVGGGCD